MPLVSVIVPSFNRVEVLPQALDSVFRQDFTDWELIVIDDASTDGTGLWVQAWIERNGLSARAQLYLSSTNRGVSFSRNRGVERAGGRWVAFLDSDDEWMPDRLSSQIKLLQAQPELRWVHGEEQWVRNGQLVTVPQKYQKRGGRIFSQCVDVCAVGASTVLIERSLFEELGGFREDFPVCEDYDLWLKIAARYPIGLVSETVIVKYGGHSDQLSRKYIGMDIYRCQALESQIDNPFLSFEENQHLLQVLQKRQRWLVRGAAKSGGSPRELRIR